MDWPTAAVLIALVVFVLPVVALVIGIVIFSLVNREDR